MNLLIILLLAAFAAPVTPPPAVQAVQIELRGHVVCLDRAGKRLEGCDGPNLRFAFATGDGKLHYFSPDDVATAMFTDARVRRRELQISAQVVKDQLEIVRLQSVRDGQLYDIYYFCELCNIRAYAPGLCPCCRNEMEFRETPATDQ